MKHTTLDLNGPILAFSDQPVGFATTENGGSVTLTGFATAYFPSVSGGTNTGIVTFRWYEVGVGALSDTDNITGTATTILSVSNLTSPDDNGREFYMVADYVASAYGLPGVAVTVGSARSTGNAINEPRSSGITTVTVLPLIEIIAQPANSQALINNDATFSINASLTDLSFDDLTYQWQLDGENIDDGTIVTTTVATQVDQTYTNDTSITLPSDSQDVEVSIVGASGGSGGSDSGGPGGGGGNGQGGRFTLPDGPRTLTFDIGRRGNGGSSGGQNAGGSAGSSDVASGGNGGGAGNSGWSGGGGGGGGASGVYDSVVNGYILVAGAGGGGGGGSLNRGGSGGGTAGGFGSSSGPFSISSGNAGQTKSGDGGGGGGGGGGATGGGGGGAGQDNSSGGGGGGGGQSKYNSNVATFDSQWENSGDGYANIKFTTQTSIPGVTVSKTETLVVSGSKTSTLSIRSDSVGIHTIRCIVSSANATNSPQLSDIVNFASLSVAEQYNVNIEAIGITNQASLTSINLFNGEYEFGQTGSDASSGVTNNLYSFYSPDRDIDVEVDIFGGKGYDFGSFSGGEGGFSRVRFTMQQNTEYVVTGFTTAVNTPFLYRKGTLIASVGGGGNAGSGGNGGSGGGIGIAGESGLGRGSGSGGIVYSAGTLPANGIYGSITTLTPIPPDTKANIPNGGRVLPCTKGVYWRQQGISACSDVGTTQFRLSDGTIVTNTASITRGYKAGYNIIQTAATGISGGGHGAAGATGGTGGSNGGGGGGGSGYTDGSINVVASTLGGNNDSPRVVLRVVS